MIKWIDAIKNPPTRSGEYLVWYGNTPDANPAYNTMVISYSSRWKQWNCHDEAPYNPKAAAAFKDLTHYAVLNNPAESEACDGTDSE